MCVCVCVCALCGYVQCVGVVCVVVCDYVCVRCCVVVVCRTHSQDHGILFHIDAHVGVHNGFMVFCFS